jgi:hypothetical protein
MGCVLYVGNLFILYIKNNHFVYKFNSMYVKYIDEYKLITLPKVGWKQMS